MRREKIVSSGAIAVEDLAHYRDAVTSAQSDLLAAEQALKTNQAMVDDTVVDNHPEVKTAVATLRQRYLDNSRSTIVAPVSGYVAKRAVQLGMRVTSGTTLLAIVPLNEVWVDANFICFVIWELDERHPIVNLRLFKDRNFAIGTLALMLGYAAFFAINIILPQWLQTQMGYTAIWAGLAAAPMGFLPLVLTPVIGRYATKVDLRILCSVSFLTMGASCLMRAQFNTDVDFRTIASVQMFMGIGVAFFFMPLTTIVLSNLHGNEVAEGSGLATFFRVLGGSFASSLTTWIWQRREVFHHANLTESVTQYNPAAMDYVNKMGGPTQQHLAMIDQVVTQQAYMMSTIDYFWVLGWGFMALIIIIWFTRPPFVKSGMPGAPAAGH